MAANKRSQMERERDKSIIMNLYLSRITQKDIPARLKELTGAKYLISRSQAAYDIEQIEKEFREKRVNDLIAIKNKELAKLNAIENEYWTAWHDNKHPLNLMGALRCMERRAKLLGLDEPDKLDIEERISGFSFEMIKAQLNVK